MEQPRSEAERDKGRRYTDGLFKEVEDHGFVSISQNQCNTFPYLHKYAS